MSGGGAQPAAETLPTSFFDDFYARNDDPWGFESRWYEERKRAILLASLPSRRLGRVLEIGCSTGLITADLADRADHVLGLDVSVAALDAARGRVGGHAEVTLRRGAVPGDWPEGQFDTIVLSEVGYYLSSPDLERTIALIDAAMPGDGCLVACHWRHPVSEYPAVGRRGPSRTAVVRLVGEPPDPRGGGLRARSVLPDARVCRSPTARDCDEHEVHRGPRGRRPGARRGRAARLLPVVAGRRDRAGAGSLRSPRRAGRVHRWLRRDRGAASVRRRPHGCRSGRRGARPGHRVGSDGPARRARRSRLDREHGCRLHGAGQLDHVAARARRLGRGPRRRHGAARLRRPVTGPSAAVARHAHSGRSERSHARRESRRPREHVRGGRRLQRTDRARGRPPGRRVPPVRGDGGCERRGRGPHVGALHRAHPGRLRRVPPRPGAVTAPREQPISSRRETDDERSGRRARCGRHRDLTDLGRRRGRGADDPASRVRVGGDHLRFGRHAAARPDARRTRGRAGRERRLGGAAGRPSGRRHPYARERRPAPDRPDRDRARHAGIRHRPGAARGRGAALPRGGGRAVHRQPERGEHPPLRALRLRRDGAGRPGRRSSRRSICASASAHHDGAGRAPTGGTAGNREPGVATG